MSSVESHESVVTRLYLYRKHVRYSEHGTSMEFENACFTLTLHCCWCFVERKGLFIREEIEV